MLACVSAWGQSLPPLIVFKSKKVQSLWLPEESSLNQAIALTENGLMEREVFAEWFEEQFCPTVTQRPLILIYDGHLSHISLPLISKAIDQNIVILKLPSHTSHRLQPLDVAVFKGLKSTFEKKVVNCIIAKATQRDSISECLLKHSATSGRNQ